MSGSPAQGPATGRKTPRAFGFRGQKGLISEVPKDRKKRHFTFKGIHKTSYALGSKAKEVIVRNLEWTYLLVRESLPGEDGGRS